MTTGYIVRSTINPSLILCKDGEFRAEGIHTGPGAYPVRVYKTYRGAQKAAQGADGHTQYRVVQPLTGVQG